MKLSELFRKVPQFSNHIIWNDSEITGITYDSRKVREGNIFLQSEDSKMTEANIFTKQSEKEQE